MPITIFSHPSCYYHENGVDHPECPERLSAINDQLIRSGMEYVVMQRDASPASKEALYLAHGKLYVDELFAKAPTEGHIWLDPDTIMGPKSLNAALHAAGSGLNAVDQVMAGTNEQAFCAVRPPGHHATREQAMGFCLLNNIAIAAEHALNQYQLSRVAIVDFDVHHGNGTDAMARKHENIFYASTHQSRIYPNTGNPADNIEGRILNVPMNAGEGSIRFREIYNHQILPAVRAFKPDLLMISAGFDAHKDDPLAQIEVETEDFGWITAELVKIANECCGGKIVSVLEGGYNLAALSDSVASHLKNLMA